MGKDLSFVLINFTWAEYVFQSIYQTKFSYRLESITKDVLQNRNIIFYIKMNTNAQITLNCF